MICTRWSMLKLLLYMHWHRELSWVEIRHLGIFIAGLKNSNAPLSWPCKTFHRAAKTICGLFWYGIYIWTVGLCRVVWSIGQTRLYYTYKKRTNWRVLCTRRFTARCNWTAQIAVRINSSIRATVMCTNRTAGARRRHLPRNFRSSSCPSAGVETCAGRLTGDKSESCAELLKRFLLARTSAWPTAD